MLSNLIFIKLLKCLPFIPLSFQCLYFISILQYSQDNARALISCARKRPAGPASKVFQEKFHIEKKKVEPASIYEGPLKNKWPKKFSHIGHHNNTNLDYEHRRCKQKHVKLGWLILRRNENLNFLSPIDRMYYAMYATMLHTPTNKYLTKVK